MRASGGLPLVFPGFASDKAVLFRIHCACQEGETVERSEYTQEIGRSAVRATGKIQLILHNLTGDSHATSAPRQQSSSSHQLNWSDRSLSLLKQIQRSSSADPPTRPCSPAGWRQLPHLPTSGRNGHVCKLRVVKRRKCLRPSAWHQNRSSITHRKDQQQHDTGVRQDPACNGCVGTAVGCCAFRRVPPRNPAAMHCA